MKRDRAFLRRPLIQTISIRDMALLGFTCRLWKLAKLLNIDRERSAPERADKFFILQLK